MEFCGSCSILDIRLVSFISHLGADDNPRLADDIRSLGRLNEIRDKYKTCPLCRLVFAIFRSGSFKRITGISDLSNIAVFAKWVNPLGSGRDARLRTSATSILVWTVSPQVPSDAYKVVIRAVSSILQSQPHFGRLSPVQSSFLNFESIRSWLHHCRKNHTSCRTAANSKPTQHFFVIDIRDRCIIEPQESCSYIALSYVWGGVAQYTLNEDNFEQLKVKHSIHTRYLTATVRDAMVLTEKLGERYLWVDALCII